MSALSVSRISDFKIEIENAKSTDDVLMIGVRASDYMDSSSMDSLKKIARIRIGQIMGVR